MFVVKTRANTAPNKTRAFPLPPKRIFESSSRRGEQGYFGPHVLLDIAYADFHAAGPFSTKRAVWLYATY
jgi:hypothetical protein